MFADYHVHTEFSDDSVYPMEDVIRDAVEMGMGEICITDHVDYGVKKDWDQGEIRSGFAQVWNLAFSGIPSQNMKNFFTDILLTLLSCPYIRWKTRSSGPRIFREGRLRRSIIWDIMRNF